MATKRPNKSLYKIYLVNRDKYYSSSNNKATWNSLNWALSAASDVVRLRYATPDQIQIHEFPVVDAIKHSYPELLVREQEIVKEKEEKKRVANQERMQREQIAVAKRVLKDAQENMKKAVDYLKSQGIEVETLNTI
jgi:hypothetical protein